MIEQSIREFNEYVLQIGQVGDDDDDDTMEANHVHHNTVLQEMIQLGVSYGFCDSQGRLLQNFKPIIDVLEIYCSADSQLTSQC